MTPERFAYWLQGFAELNQQPPTAEQWQSIRDHLATVFEKVTPRPTFSEQVLGPLFDEGRVCTGSNPEDKMFFVDFNNLPKFQG